MTSLRELPIGKTATIRSVGGEGALRQHFLDMGLIPKGEVTMVKYAPMGDPMELRIHSYELIFVMLLSHQKERQHTKKIFLKQSHTLVLVRVVNIILKKTNIRFRTVKY